jgi:hypothetical protein
MKPIRCVGILSLSLQLSGCISIDHQNYPKDWPQISASPGTCPDLSGIYANFGRGEPNILLANWVLPRTNYPLEQIDQVEFSGPSNEIVITRLIKTPAIDVAVRQWQQGVEYCCENGWLLLTRSNLAQAIPVFMGSFHARFARTVDGQLIAEVNERGGGIVLVTPMISAYRHWHMYPLVSH